MAGYALVLPDGEMQVIPADGLRIGRAAENEVRLDVERVSRHHATVWVDEAGQVLIRDENSTNGTFVNGALLAPVTPHPLQPGDEIRIETVTLGLAEMQVEPPPEPAATPEAGEPLDEAQWIEQASRALSDWLEQQPEAMQVIERIVAERLHYRQGRVDANTAGEVFDSLALYTGGDRADFLLTLLIRGIEEREFFDRVGAHLSRRVQAFVQAMMSLYGSTLAEAYLLRGENPNGWRTVNRQVYYDLMSRQWRTTFEIIKYSGEKTVYEGDPASLLALASAVLDTLNVLPRDVAPALIDEGRVKTFEGLCATFFELFAPVADQASGEALAAS